MAGQRTLSETPAGVLGLVAGGGRFPFLVAAEARATGIRVAAAAIRGNTDPGLAGQVDFFRELKLGQLGGLIDYFRSQGVDRIVMAGTIRKAAALDMIPDWRGAKLLLTLRGKGDDALLRAVIGELESEGFMVLKAHELLPQLLTPAGVLAGAAPQELWEDVRYGWAMARQIGSLDIGQTVVMKRQVVAAVEALEGTDEAIERGCALAGPGALVIKVCKPGQDRRVDLPSIGLQTIRVMAAGRASCLAVEAGRSLFFERAEALAAAAAAGITVLGLTDAGEGGKE